MLLQSRVHEYHRLWSNLKVIHYIAGLEQLNNTLYMLFEDEDLHPETRIKMLNVTKMTLYVTVEFLKSFQEKVDQTYSLVIDKVTSLLILYSIVSFQISAKIVTENRTTQY